MRRLAALLVPAALCAQAPIPGPSSAHIEALKKLSFLHGNWKGDGWMAFGPGAKRTFSQTEKVQPMLSGTTLMVEGQGMSEGRITHHALAMLTWDAATSTYRMRSQVQEGFYKEFEVRVLDKGFEWKMKDPRGATLRYTMKLTAEGKWVETGERSVDEQSWMTFFEMTLTKQNQ